MQLFRRNLKNLMYGNFSFGLFFHHFSLWLGTRVFIQVCFVLVSFSSVVANIGGTTGFLLFRRLCGLVENWAT